MIKAVLFDLDGTLLPMNQELFVKAYFSGLSKKAAPYGYEPSKLVKTIWTGTAAMVKNDGAVSNEELFWNLFTNTYGANALKDKCLFDDFYAKEFELVKDSCGFNHQARNCVKKVKAKGYMIALATNPIFPEIATKARIRWAGLDASDFEICTTYENSRYCKPNLNYYWDIVKALDVLPEECLMIGNDVDEDMVVTSLGMKVFLITDCLINKGEKDISVYPQGSLTELIDFLEQI